MDPTKVKAALDALINGDTEACASILKDMIAAAASGGDTPPADDGAALNDAADPPPPEKDDDTLAAATKLARELREELTSLSAKVAELTAVRSSAELGERQDLVAELVKLGAETPATAWAGDPSKRQPCKRLAGEPLPELRERVKALSAAGSRTLTPPPSGAAPDGARVIKTSRGDVTLTAREIKNCESTGASVEAYAENKAIRDAARRGEK